MPKRRRLPKTPDYIGTTRKEEAYLVQKSNPLQSLSETPMTLSEFKILDAYLSRIDSHNPDKRFVRFEKGELEKLLGVSRIPKADLEKRLKNLFQVVSVRDGAKKSGFTYISLFAMARCEQDDDELWQVDLACTSEAMEYIFNIDEMGYLPYLLRNVVELTSRYSYILFLYIERNRWRTPWEVSLTDLKKLLNCTAERYEEFKFFNAEILKKCHKEITEKTDVRYTYEPIRKSRKVVAIKFAAETINEQLSLLDDDTYTGDIIEKEFKNDNIGFLAEITMDEFTEKEYTMLWTAVCEAVPNSNGTARFDYFISKWNRFNVYSERKKITDRFNYLLKMLETEE